MMSLFLLKIIFLHDRGNPEKFQSETGGIGQDSVEKPCHTKESGGQDFSGVEQVERIEPLFDLGIKLTEQTLGLRCNLLALALVVVELPA